MICLHGNLIVRLDGDTALQQQIQMLDGFPLPMQDLPLRYVVFPHDSFHLMQYRS